MASPTLLGAHEMGHLAVDPTAAGIKKDDDGWMVISTQPPANATELISRFGAGVIAEVTLERGRHMARIYLGESVERWHTDIGEHDFAFLRQVPIQQLMVSFDAVSSTIETRLLEIGRARLHRMGKRLLEMDEGQVLDFRFSDA